MSTEAGHRAEDLAADYLRARGLKVIDRNWRNRFCEIDIVAKDKADTIHFVEVKHRSSSDFGGGFEYITPDKIQRLKRAAQFWISEQPTQPDYQIDIIAVSGHLDNLPTIELLTNAVGD